MSLKITLDAQSRGQRLQLGRAIEHEIFDLEIGSNFSKARATSHEKRPFDCAELLRVGKYYQKGLWCT